MSGNGKQICILDCLPKMRYRVSDSSNLEQSGVKFSFLVIMDHSGDGIMSVLNNLVIARSRLPGFRRGKIPHASFQT